MRTLAVALLLGTAPITLTTSANGTTVSARVGQTIQVTLPANASTGYAWQVVSTGAPTLTILSTRYVAPTSTLLGAPGTFVARVKVARPGRAVFSLTYRRHAATAPTAKRFRVTIAATR